MSGLVFQHLVMSQIVSNCLIRGPRCNIVIDNQRLRHQGMNIVQEGVGVQGDQIKFARYGHLATRFLELLRDGLHGPMQEDTQPEIDEDHIVGRYIYVNRSGEGQKSFMRRVEMEKRRFYSATPQEAIVVN